MSNISVNLYCIQIRSGVEIWVEHKKAEALQRVLESITSSKFILFDDETINTADIVGVFKAGTMQEASKRRSGQWKCENGSWHDKNHACTCLSQQKREYNEKIAEAIRNCGKCSHGWVEINNKMARCECVLAINQ